MLNVNGINRIGSTISVSSWDVYYVDKTDIEEVIVYNSSDNEPFKAYKYILNNTDYYYVLDGTQTDWTDDLSSIGYSLTPVVVLPTVTVTTEWVSQDKSATSLNNTYRRAVYDNEGTHFPYSSQLVYAPIKWFVSEQDTSGNSALNTELSNFSSYPDYLYITNNTGYTITIQRIQFAVCSDSTATVVPVYDSNNIAYNAFKYTANNVDYYYVLDGTQTDWAYDLSSIGYSLYQSSIDIDTNFGLPVTIPEGYTIQSVKSTVAYAFAQDANVGIKGSFNILGKDVYCTDTDTNLLGYKIKPCLQIFQITTINGQITTTGYYLSSRPSQTTIAGMSVYRDACVLNGLYNNQDVFIHLSFGFQSAGPTQNVVTAINEHKPLQLRRYDSNDTLIDYYFNVPPSLWQYQNGVFQWLGDSTSKTDLSYFYLGLVVKIHCVRS